MPRPLWLLGTAAVVLATACGTTVHLGVAGPAAGTSPGLNAPSSTSPSGGDTAPATTVSGAAPTGSSSGPAAASPSSASYTGATADLPAGSAPGIPPSNGKDGPGVTPTSIAVGLIYATNTAAYEAALGPTAVTTPDEHALAQVVVDDINKTGGMAGRKLIPQYYAQSATDTSSTDQRAQAQCASLTQDHKVFGAAPAQPFYTPFNACMTRAGAVLGGGSLTGITAAEYRAYPNLYDVTALNLDRLMVNLVQSLVRQQYFTSWDTTGGAPGHGPVKVGIVAPDTPEYASTVKSVLVPSLAGAGIKVAPQDTYLYSWPNSNADDGATIADIQAAELRMRSDGVTHVIAPEVNGLVFFAGDADRQHFRPRYSVDTADNPQGYAGNLLPVNQLHGAVGFGWLPMEDLSFAQNPDNGPYSSDARRSCIGLMKANGQGNFTSANAEAVALAVCDLLYTMRDVIDHIPAGQPINQATFSASLASMGAVASGTLPKAFFGTNHTDAASEAWDYRFFDDCSCLHYTGSMYTLS